MDRRKNFLTTLLIIIIVIIVGIIGYLGYELADEKIKESKSDEFTDEFDDLIPTISEEEFEEESEYYYEEQEEQEEDDDELTLSEGQDTGSSGSTSGNSGTSSSSGSSSSGTRRTRTNYSTYNTGVEIGGYWVVGTIRISATNIKYSIFSQPSTKALERGVGMIYTTNGLNQPGMTVIAGHNYRNRSFFSRNKNLVVGNLIQIKDASGVEVTYSVAEKFVTNQYDTSFYQRDTNGRRAITLTSCTDNGLRTGERLIIIAYEV